MFKKIFSLLIFSVLSLGLFSQELKDDLSRLQNGEDVNVLYRNESSFGIYVHSAGGFGIAYRRGKHVTGNRKRMFELEAQNFKNPKEVKSVNSYFENSKGFSFGKLNSFFILRPGVGHQNILYKKNDKKNVEIRYSYFLGAALAFAKPVYLEIKRDQQSNVSPTTERYDPEIHTIDIIYGKAPFFKGIEKTQIIPGGYAKLALSFEYADRYSSIKAVETGVVFDVYPKPLPMMAYQKNQQFFASLFLKIIWGKKWF
jgi:hypothetical protein